MAHPFSVVADGRTVRVIGDLDIATTPEFERVVEPLGSEPGDVVLDASDMTFIDSSGIRAVFALARQLEGSGRLSVVGVGEQVRRVLDLVHAESVVDVRVESR